MLGVERNVGKASFRESRRVGQIDPALFRGDGKPAHHAGLHLRLRAGERGQQQIDGAGEQRLRRRPAAVERNIGDVEPGFELEQLHGELRRGAVAGARIIELARLGLGRARPFRTRN